MPRRGDSIRKRIDGRWEGRYIAYYSEEGKVKYKSVYGHSYSEVKNKLLSALGVTSTREGMNNFTFEEIARQWLAQKQAELKPSTYDKYLTIISNHLVPTFGNVPITQIEAIDIESYYQSMRTSISISMIKTIASVVRSIFNYAEKQKIISKSIGRIQLPKIQQNKASGTLTSRNRALLEQHLLSDMDLCKLGIYLCLYTGLRIGELCALKWSEIDLFSGIIKVRHTVQRIKKRSGEISGKTEIVITTPKSCSSVRDIPIPKPLCQHLESVKKPDDYFFMSDSIDAPMEPRCLQYRFKKILLEANIEDVNFHALRHSFASECIAVGFDVKSLSEILGHTNVEITLNRYVHSSEERKRAQMSLLFSENGQLNQAKA